MILLVKGMIRWDWGISYGIFFLLVSNDDSMRFGKNPFDFLQ